MKTTKAKPFGRKPERPRAAELQAKRIDLIHCENLTRACQAMFDRLVSDGLSKPVALARVVGEVFFKWAPTVVDIHDPAFSEEDYRAVQEFEEEMRRLSDKYRPDDEGSLL